MRDIALKEEIKICNSDIGVTPTLLGLSSSLSRSVFSRVLQFEVSSVYQVTHIKQHFCYVLFGVIACMVVSSSSFIIFFFFFLNWNLLINFIDISLCSGAECLLQIVHGAIPQAYFQPNTYIPASEMAVHILDYLYKKLDEVCLVQGGEVVTTSFSSLLFCNSCGLLFFYNSC